MRICKLYAAAFLFAACLSCSRNPYAELGLIEVQGIVTVDGIPLPGAKVSFEGEDLRQAIGITDAQGHYKLMYDSETPGALPGMKKVRVTTADVEVEGDGPAEGSPETKERIPARYNIDSMLRADVSKAKQTFDFDLKSKP